MPGELLPTGGGVVQWRGTRLEHIRPYPLRHVHGGRGHGGRFGLLRLVVRGQRGGDAVGRRHWEIPAEASVCGGISRRRGQRRGWGELSLDEEFN